MEGSKNCFHFLPTNAVHLFWYNSYRALTLRTCNLRKKNPCFCKDYISTVHLMRTFLLLIEQFYRWLLPRTSYVASLVLYGKYNFCSFIFSQTRHIAEHNALMLIKVSILLPKFGFGSYGTHPIPTLIVLNMHYSYRENKLHKVLMKNFLKNISSNHTFANSWFFKLKFLPDATYWK